MWQDQDHSGLMPSLRGGARLAAVRVERRTVPETPHAQTPGNVSTGCSRCTSRPHGQRSATNDHRSRTMDWCRARWDQREAVVVAGERCTAGGGDSAEWPTSAMAAGDPRREVARADTREARSQCTRSGGGAPKRVGNAASDKVTTLNARASEPFQSPIGRRLLAATDRPPRLVARRTKRTISIRQALEARAGQRRVINRVEPPRT